MGDGARLRVLVVGQSPRPLMAAEIAAAAPGVEVVLEGALDGMSRAAIAAEAGAVADADALFTVLPSGETVTISKAFVGRRMVNRLRKGGVTLLCCTGAFEGVPERAEIVRPSAVLDGLVQALLPAGVLGLVVPLVEQEVSLAAARGRPGLRTVAMTLRPGSGAEAVAGVAQRMAAVGPGLVVLDCMSFTRADKAIVAGIVGCPVLLSIAVAARAAACLLAE